MYWYMKYDTCITLLPLIILFIPSTTHFPLSLTNTNLHRYPFPVYHRSKLLLVYMVGLSWSFYVCPYQLFIADLTGDHISFPWRNKIYSYGWGNRNEYHCIFPLWSIWSCPSKRAHISGVADRFDSSTNSQWCACYAFKQKPLSTFKDVVKSFAHHNSIWTYLVSLRLVNRDKLWTNMHFHFITNMITHLYKNLFTFGHEI